VANRLRWAIAPGAVVVGALVVRRRAFARPVPVADSAGDAERPGPTGRRDRRDRSDQAVRVEADDQGASGPVGVRAVGPVGVEVGPVGVEAVEADGPGGQVDAVGDELMVRVEASFRDLYLQLLSIIQGFAFGFLATTTLEHKGQLDPAEWVALAGCLATIVVVWQDYMVGATAFAWVPTLLDTIVPFGLGIAEFAMIAPEP
jgi:hypothetical protein